MLWRRLKKAISNYILIFLTIYCQFIVNIIFPENYGLWLLNHICLSIEKKKKKTQQITCPCYFYIDTHRSINLKPFNCDSVQCSRLQTKDLFPWHTPRYRCYNWSDACVVHNPKVQKIIAYSLESVPLNQQWWCRRRSYRSDAAFWKRRDHS